MNKYYSLINKFIYLPDNIYSKYFSENHKIPKNLMWFTKNNYYIKEPFIDVFLFEIDKTENRLKFITINKTVNYFDNFNNHTKKIKLYDFDIYVPNDQVRYLSNYYNKSTEEIYANYINNFKIKGIHGNKKNEILFSVNKMNPLEKMILDKLNKYYTEIIIELSKQYN